MENQPDVQIRTRILLELNADPRLRWVEIAVEVREGVATLKGVVRTYAKKFAAAEAAHRVEGVLVVVNLIKVTRHGIVLRNDEDLAHAVTQVLKREARNIGPQIRASVSRGWVTLEGCVDRWRQREDAERSVLRLHGVAGVINQIR